MFDVRSQNMKMKMFSNDDDKKIKDKLACVANVCFG